jgi:hypothetical protein
MAFFVEKALKATITGLLRTFGPMEFARHFGGRGKE